jgi:CspA family cold shock protein
MQEHYGKIARYFNDRGFGFIAGDDGNEVFFHIRYFTPAGKAPNVGARVRYNVRANNRDGRPEAIDIEETGEKSNAKPQTPIRGNDPIWR